MKIRIIKNGNDLYVVQEYISGDWYEMNQYILMDDAIEMVEMMIEQNRIVIKNREVKEIIREYSI